MNCTPQALLQAAACYRCIPKKVMQASMISLLCEWANHLAPPFSYEPQTELISWIDSGGNHTGDLATFYSITATTGTDTVTSVNAGGNPITSVSNVSSLPALSFFDFSATIISSLDVTGCSTLETLLVNDTNLASITGLTTCTSLVTLQCQNSLMTGGLDLTGLSNLDLVYCYSNSLTDIDCSNCTSITTLNCSSNASLTTLTLTGCTALVTLNCLGCNVNPSLDVTGLVSLSSLEGALNPNLHSITGLLGCSALTFLELDTCDLTGTFSTSGLTLLQQLWIPNNLNLSQLDASGCSGVVTIDVNNSTSLTSIDMTGCTLLTSLFLTNSLVTSLDITAAVGIDDVECYANSLLSSVKLGGSTQYTTVIIQGSALVVAPNGVDKILSDLATNCLTNAGGCDLSLGTNASPTGGILNADYVALTGAGWSVTIN